ncbi:unnamed protein product [Mucor hiemalis]
MAIQELPLEILQNIFDNVEHTDLHNILYLSKKWHFLVKNIYFQSVNFHGKEKMKWLKEFLSTSINGMQIIRPLSMTKQLSIARDYDSEGHNHMNDEYLSLHTQLTKEEFLLLLSLFPNLKKLDLGESFHSYHYMKILGDCELEKMPLLEKIGLEYNAYGECYEKSRMLRLAVYHNFRRSIKNVEIKCMDARETKFMKTLADFTSLAGVVSGLNFIFHCLRIKKFNTCQKAGIKKYFF